jgi:hypothetical protein
MNRTGAWSLPRSRTLPALVALAAALTVTAVVVPVFHAQPRLAPDSITYLEAHVMRTPIYPLTLRVLHSLPGSLDLLAPFQLLLFASAGVLLAYEFVRTYKQPVLGLALEAMVLGNPLLVSYCFVVLPEAVFAAVLMVHLSFLLIIARRATALGFAGASLSAAALALVKPSGYAAVAGLAVLAFLHREEWRKLLWLVLPAAVAISAVSTANLLIRGFFGTQALSGSIRLAHVASLLETTTPTPYPILTRRLASQARPIGNALHSLPTIDDYYLIAAEEYHGVEELVWRELIEEIRRRGREPATGTGLLPKDPAVAAVHDKLGSSVANAAIRQHFGEYLYDVAANTYGLWWLPLVKTRRGVAARQSELDDLVAHRSSLRRPTPAFRGLPLVAYLAVRTVLLCVFACSLAGLFWIASRSPLRRVVAYVALFLHGYFLLVSLAQPGLPRYAVVVWPASALLLTATAGSIRYRESHPRLQ